MTLIQSHTYTINLANVNYIREYDGGEFGTIFRMNNNKTVQITCPYDSVMKQLRGAMNTMNGAMTKEIITLDY
jgi:hypothetical protein